MLPRLISDENNHLNKKAEDSELIDRSLRNYYAAFPKESIVRSILKNAFVINHPLDQVGGDGYWLHEDNGTVFLVVFDCMGHGRLASIMTRVFVSAIKQTIVEDKLFDPGQILTAIHFRIKAYFETKNNTQVGSGADIGILKIDSTNSEIAYAGAKMDLIYTYKGEVRRIKSNKRQVGDLFEFERSYETIKLELEDKNEKVHIYLFTDGVTDLIGGSKNKKLKFSGFQSMLEKLPDQFEHHKPLLESRLSKWSGINHQTDDLLLIGLSISA